MVGGGGEGGLDSRFADRGSRFPAGGWPGSRLARFARFARFWSRFAVRFGGSSGSAGSLSGSLFGWPGSLSGLPVHPVRRPVRLVIKSSLGRFEPRFEPWEPVRTTKPLWLLQAMGGVLLHRVIVKLRLGGVSYPLSLRLPQARGGLPP